MSFRNANELKRSRLSAALITALVLPVAGGAFAQSSTEQAKPESKDPATTLDKVSVVGSRIKRAELEGPAPVTVITRADIDREGFQTVGDMLQTLTQNTTSSYTGDLGVTGFSPNAQVVNLRNLGPGYTLTLVNGRRPAQYPQPYNRDNNVVNVKAIPSSIVERIEVLTGGASAIYGSDAVAGVVNIVLREHFDGDQVRLTTGTTTEGGGDNVKVEFTGGKTGDRWSATYAFQYNENEPVFATQRDFLTDTRNNPYGLAVNPALSMIAIIQSTSKLGKTGQNAYYPGQAACDAFGYSTVTTATRGTYCGSYTQSGSRSIWNKNRAYSGYGYGTFDVTDNLQLFGSASYYKTDGKSSGGTEFWGTSGDRFTQTKAGAATSVYYDPQLGSLIQLQRVFNPFELGGNEAASTLYGEHTYDVTFGATGRIADRFDWEAFADYSEYSYTSNRPRLLAKAVHDYFLGPQLGWNGSYAVYNLNLARWSTPITPDIYRSFATRVINEGTTSSATANFNISGDLFELPAGAVSVAGVLEANRQKTDLVSDPRTNQLRPIDDQTIYNLTSSGETHGQRDRYAVGLEFRVPIFSTLTANLAGRYDKYDDITAVDDAITSQFGLEWRPFSSLLLRASYATSFRAPDMQLVFAEGAASYASILDEYACRSGIGLGQATPAVPRTVTQCNAVTGDLTKYQTQTVIAGNPLLQEEKGKSWGAGFVWDIIDNMSLSVDYYKIRLEDAASQLSSSYLLTNEANCRLGVKPDGSAYEYASSSSFCQNIYGLVTRQSAPGTGLDGKIDRINSAYINTAVVETSGIDATFKYRYDTDRYGTFMADLGYSLLLTNKYKEFDSDPLVDYRDEPWDYSQRSRARGTLGWSKGDWSTSVFGTRYGSNWNAAWNARLKPYMIYNLQVNKKFGPNVKAGLTIVNVLNNQFREDPTYTAYPYYNAWIGADPVGRRVFFDITYKF